jgi:hypothetical protein
LRQRNCLVDLCAAEWLRRVARHTAESGDDFF